MPYKSPALPSRYSTHTPSSAPAWGGAALLAVAGLAASLLYVQGKKRAAERDNPPQGKFIEVDGVRLHYLERGEGNALVLLHGNGLFSDDFALSGLLERAAQTHRVIVFDRPGFGHSERPSETSWTPEAQAKLFYKALHQLGVERPIVLGHSWGTLVALAMALDFPRYIRGLGLVSGYYYPSARLDVPLAAAPAIPVLGQLLRNTISPLLGRMLWRGIIKKTFGPEQVPTRFEHYPKWMSLRPSQLGAAAAESGLMIPSAARLSQRYRELTLPIAVIAGSGDLVSNADANAVRFHQEVQHSALHIEPGVGHMVHYAAPEQLMEAVARLEADATSFFPGAPAQRPTTLH